MSEHAWKQTWGQQEEKYRKADETANKYGWDVEDIETEVDGSVDAWVRQLDAVGTVTQLEAELDGYKRANESARKMHTTVVNELANCGVENSKLREFIEKLYDEERICSWEVPVTDN